MLIDGKRFHGSTSYSNKHNSLRSVAGNASWFTDIQPLHFPSIRTFHMLLFHFYRHALRCFVRQFYLLHSGFSNFFRAVAVYPILDVDHPIIRFIFQKGPHVIQNLIISLFHFELLQTLHDSRIYRVRLCHFNAIMCFVVIDAASRCDYRSNVDFAHFIWYTFERFSTRKFAITILPSDNVPAPLNLSSALPSSTR